jgi:hypothetical protein
MSLSNAARTADRRAKRVKRVIPGVGVYETAWMDPEGKALEAREARDFLLRAFSDARPLRRIQRSGSVKAETACNSESRASRAPRAASKERRRG